jgi:phenylpropionate dioxygenase-like ring-hydroxylating dioxygenase large terminal subunit
MLNAWYVASTSEELQETGLLARTIWDREIVLFRDAQGEPHALVDQCPHRGARLSNGKHEGDRIACPFHGWQFEGDGVCRHIPANGTGAPIPARACTRSYPVQEAAGLLWVYLASAERQDEEPEALQLPPELTEEGWRNIPFAAEWEAHITRVVESILDVAHLPFVHPASTGDVDPTVSGPEFEVSEREILIYAQPYHPLVATPLNEEDARGMSTITFTWPNQLILRTDMHVDSTMATYLAMTPVSHTRTVIYGLSLRNFLTDMELIDDVHYEHNVTVLEEDRPVVEALRPKVSPLDPRAEVHVRADAQQVRYRLMLRRLWKDESRKNGGDD